MKWKGHKKKQVKIESKEFLVFEFVIKFIEFLLNFILISNFLGFLLIFGFYFS